MENYYNNIPTDEQEMRDHVSHFMYRTDMVMKQPVTIHDRHDDLCRLVITIADYYPDSIAPNPGRVLAFRKAVVDPVTGLKAHFDFETFVQLFKQNVGQGTGTCPKSKNQRFTSFFPCFGIWARNSGMNPM